MAVIYSDLEFLNNTGMPIIGSLANAIQPNCLKMAYNKVDGLVPGDPVVVLVSESGAKINNTNTGYNPNTQTITAKATTDISGANSTNVCGFMTFNPVDKVKSGGLPLPQQGELLNYAPLGQGALIWLEVAKTNESDFQANLDTNMSITIDSTHGGVKVGSGANILAGAKVIQGLTQCRKIKLSGGNTTLEPCTGILVQLS